MMQEHERAGVGRSERQAKEDVRVVLPQHGWKANDWMMMKHWMKEILWDTMT